MLFSRASSASRGEALAVRSGVRSTSRRARAPRAARDAHPRATARWRPSTSASRARSRLDGDWRAVGAHSVEERCALLAAAQARLRAKLSYTNLGFALAPEVFTISELREVYVAALGHDVSATNLQRVLLRRGAFERVDGHRAPGRTGGRPAALFRFASQRLEVTDEFAALRPPR